MKLEKRHAGSLKRTRHLKVDIETFNKVLQNDKNCFNLNKQKKNNKGRDAQEEYTGRDAQEELRNCKVLCFLGLPVIIPEPHVMTTIDEKEKGKDYEKVGKGKYKEETAKRKVRSKKTK